MAARSVADLTKKRLPHQDKPTERPIRSPRTGVAIGLSASRRATWWWFSGGSLSTAREKSVRIDAKVVGHGRYVTFRLTEVATLT